VSWALREAWPGGFENERVWVPAFAFILTKLFLICESIFCIHDWRPRLPPSLSASQHTQKTELLAGVCEEAAPTCSLSSGSLAPPWMGALAHP
jgi:hypothetical protein